jgi:Fe-S-cluster containining protein
MANSPFEILKKNKEQKKQLLKFLRGLTHRKVIKLDEKAIALNKEAFKKVDCLQCANCCKTMHPTWKKAEVKRVAKHLGMTYKQYFDKYLVIEEKDIMNKKAPCQHLAKDNTCKIYDIRPSDCSGFPHTQNKGFKLYISGTHIQNMDYCPITVSVVEGIFNKVMDDKKLKM